MSQEVNDYRKDKRITLGSFSQVYLENLPVTVNALDLSLHGLRCQCNASWEPGEKVTIQLFDRSIRFVADVAWNRALDDTRHFGVKLEETSFHIVRSALEQLPGNFVRLEIVYYTPIPLISESLQMYLSLVNAVNFHAYNTIEEAQEHLKQKHCDLFVIDHHEQDLEALLDFINNLDKLGHLPMLVLSKEYTEAMLKWRKSNMFLEILKKPVDLQDLLMRSILLIERSYHFRKLEEQQLEGERKIKELQDSFETQNQEMMGMLTQVMQQSDAMGQVIQFQEALLGLKSFDELIHFSQSWTLDKFKTLTNIWYFDNGRLTLLGVTHKEHSEFTEEERRQRIFKLMEQNVKIYQEDLILIRKTNFILEVFPNHDYGEVVESLTFFMKVLAPVLQQRMQSMQLENAHEQTAMALQLEQRAREKLNQEMQQAAEVQDILIPKMVPVLEAMDIACHYQSAADIGGDWFQVSEYHQQQQIMIAIGDVTGHGAQAALVTAIASGFFAEVRIKYNKPENRGKPLPSPAELLQELNLILCDVTKGWSLMTFYLSVYDPKLRQLTFASAAHNPPLHFRPKGFETGNRRVKPMVLHGYRLGNRKDSEYTESVIQLQPGDTVLWYTDGLTECINPEQEEYSIRRLSNLLDKIGDSKCSEIKKMILHDIAEFRNDSSLEDDLAFVLAKVRR